MPSNLEPKDFQAFSSLEKEALKEISLDIIKSDLQKSLQELHQKSMADVANRISTIEARCTKEIKDGLEKHIQNQLDKHFQKVVQSYQADISKILSPLMKRAEGDVNQLNAAINKVQEFCQKIENQYALRWSRPFFALTLSAGFAGALMGLWLFLLQIPSVSVFFMNEHTREAYETGTHTLELRRELEAQSLEQKAVEIQKTPENPIHSRPKKKKSK
ncbi:MAG: hypothetical protein JSR85_00890 [Proteobacteria bacterium]|nr:hypothetical protein [Pseudomonadota bacterium]